MSNSRPTVAEFVRANIDSLRRFEAKNERMWARALRERFLDENAYEMVAAVAAAEGCSMALAYALLVRFISTYGDLEEE